MYLINEAHFPITEYKLKYNTNGMKKRKRREGTACLCNTFMPTGKLYLLLHLAFTNCFTLPCTLSILSWKINRQKTIKMDKYNKTNLKEKAYNVRRKRLTSSTLHWPRKLVNSRNLLYKMVVSSCFIACRKGQLWS